MYDLIIAGAGPAGITAAVYAARKKLDVLIITENIGGQAAWSSDIENYTGFQFITGSELSQKFEDHVKGFESIKVIQDKKVECIDREEGNFTVKTDSEKYQGKAVIMATGRTPRMLGVPGEAKFKNKGVTYCATCDGPLFNGMDVAVVGGGNSALDATLQLTKIANKIYMININDGLVGDEVMIEKISSAKNVEILNNTETKEILGGKFVEKIRVSKNGQESELDVKGVFIEVGSIPVKEPGKCEGLELNEINEVVVNRKCETNIPGLFAAGDVTDVPEKQIIVAAGEGCIASLSAYKYISRQK